MLLSFIVLVLHLSGEKNENKQKTGRVWPIFKKKKTYLLIKMSKNHIRVSNGYALFLISFEYNF